MKEDEPLEEDSGRCSLRFYGMTKWHVIILLCTALGTVLEGLIPHSFGTFIANFRSGVNRSSALSQDDVSFTEATQFQLDWLPALSSALPSILLPLFSLAIDGARSFYQVVSVVSFVLVAFSCILSSLVTQWRLFFLTYSFMYSVGTSLFLAVVISILTDYFPLHHRCHVLATSLYQIGYPIAALVGNPMSASLIIGHGWRNTFRYMALVQVSLGTLVGVSMKPYYRGLCGGNIGEDQSSEETPVCGGGDQNDDDVSEKVPGRMDISLGRVLANQRLWTWMAAKYLNYMCWYGFRTNVVTFLVSTTSFGLQLSAFLMSAYAAAEICVAIMASILGDGLRGWLVHVHLVAAVSMAILTGIYPVSLASYFSGLLLMLCIGTAMQLSLSFGFPASVEVLNSDFDMKTGWIVTNVATGLGILTSPLLSGLVMDRLGLVAFFYALCIGWILQGILFGCTIVLVRREATKGAEEYDQISRDK